MTYLQTIHQTNAEHLAEVVAEMRVLGVPTIRVVEHNDMLLAIEGCHRVAAAAALGLPINFEVVSGDTIDLDTLDWDDNGWFDDRATAPLDEVISRMFSQPAGKVYSMVETTLAESSYHFSSMPCATGSP